MKKIIFAIAFVLLASMLLVSCGDVPLDTTPDVTTPEETTPEGTTSDLYEGVSFVRNKYIIGDNAEGLYYTLGRTTMFSDGLECAWGASGIEFSAICEGKINVEIETVKKGFIAVYVDGVRVKDTYDFKLLDAGTTSIRVADNLEKGLHTIRVLNINGINSATTGYIKIKSITVSNGELQEATPADVCIEYIGDSIISGAGLCDNPDATSWEATKACSYISAQILGADHIITSRGGMGIAYGNNKKGGLDNAVNTMYPLANYARSDTDKYVPTRTPDLIVINLSANDDSYWPKDKIGDYTYYDAEFKKLIDYITELYGTKDIPIVFSLGAAKAVTSSTSYAEKRIMQLVESDEYKEYDMRTVVITQNNGGRDGVHPSAAGAQRQGEDLAAFIKAEFPELFNK